MYKLTILKTVDNPFYERDKKEYEESNNYGRIPLPGPIKLIDQEVLHVILTELEFKAIKKAVLEVCE